MKRVLVASFLLLFITIAGYSQFGVTGGINLSSLRSNADNNANIRLGAHIGGFYEVRLFNNFYLQPQLLFSHDPTSVKYPRAEETTNGYYINLPVTFSYKIPLNEKSKIGFDFGVYYSYGLFGNKKIRYTSEYNYSEPLFQDHHAEIGLISGVRYEQDSYIFSTRIRYGLISRTVIDNKVLLLMLSVGYKFGK